MAYTVPTTQSVTYLILYDVDWNTDVVENIIYLKAEADKLNTLAVAQPARTYGSIYQNTSGKTMFITLIAEMTDTQDGFMNVYVENNANPTILVVMASMDRGTATIAMVSISFCVPNGWYWTTDGDADADIYKVTEWELH